MRLLVTGGAGFIGSTFVRRVLRGAQPSSVGAEVVVLNKLTYATELGYRPTVGFTQGLADTVGWYAKYRDWWEPLKAASAVGSE